MGLCLEALNSLMYDRTLSKVSSISCSVQSLKKERSFRSFYTLIHKPQKYMYTSHWECRITTYTHWTFSQYARAYQWNKRRKLSATHTMNFNTTFFTVIGQSCRQGCVAHMFYWVELCMCVSVCIKLCSSNIFKEPPHLEKDRLPVRLPSSSYPSLRFFPLFFPLLHTIPPLQSTPSNSGLFLSAEM